jgi:hypothetical protein
MPFARRHFRRGCSCGQPVFMSVGEQTYIMLSIAPKGIQRGIQTSARDRACHAWHRGSDCGAEQGGPPELNKAKVTWSRIIFAFEVVWANTTSRFCFNHTWKLASRNMPVGISYANNAFQAHFLTFLSFLPRGIWLADLADLGILQASTFSPTPRWHRRTHPLRARNC